MKAAQMHYFHLKLSAVPPPWWMAHFMELYGVPTIVRQGQMFLAGRYVLLLSDFDRAFTYIQRARIIEEMSEEWVKMLDLATWNGRVLVPREVLEEIARERDPND